MRQRGNGAERPDAQVWWCGLDQEALKGKSMGVYNTPERFKEKFLHKTSRNPMVPTGWLCTAPTLTYGLYCFHWCQSKRSLLMMRTQVTTQNFTDAATLLGLAASVLNPEPVAWPWKQNPGLESRVLALKAPWRSFPAPGVTIGTSTRIIPSSPLTSPCVNGRGSNQLTDFFSRTSGSVQFEFVAYYYLYYTFSTPSLINSDPRVKF